MAKLSFNRLDVEEAMGETTAAFPGLRGADRSEYAYYMRALYPHTFIPSEEEKRRWIAVVQQAQRVQELCVAYRQLRWDLAGKIRRRRNGNRSERLHISISGTYAKMLRSRRNLRRERSRLYRYRLSPEAASQKLLFGTARYIVQTVCSHLNRGLSFLELFQEGARGMFHATYRFDLTRKVQFLTYATWWVRQYISRQIHEQGRCVRIPGQVVQQTGKLAGAERMLMQRLMRKPTPEEIAAEFAISPAEFRFLKDVPYHPISLSRPVRGPGGEGGHKEFEAFFALDDSVDPLEAIRRREIRDLIRALLKALPDRQRRVIEMRFGIRSRESFLKEVGEEFGVSRERVRQIETGSLQILRAMVKEMGIDPKQYLA